MKLGKEIGIDFLQKGIDVILSKISGKGGKMDGKMAPKAVSLKEETELQAMMERVELENREVEGDEPEVRVVVIIDNLVVMVDERSMRVLLSNVMFNFLTLRRHALLLNSYESLC